MKRALMILIALVAMIVIVIAADFRKAWKEQKKEKRIRRLEERINAWLTRAEEVLIRYFRLLNDWEKSYRPGVPGSDPDPRFVEAMQNKSTVEYQLNILQFGSERDRLDFSRRRERK